MFIDRAIYWLFEQPLFKAFRRQTAPRWLVLLIDMLLVTCAFAMLVLSDIYTIKHVPGVRELLRSWGIVMGVYLAVTYFSKSYTSVIRLSVIEDLYRVFLVVVHGIMFLCVAEFYRACRFERENVFTILCTFLICGELFYLFCIMRNSLALAFGLWLFALLNEKKYGLALLPLVLAVGMHLAAVILIPVYVFVLLMDKLQAGTVKKTALWLGAVLAAECIALPIFNYLIRNTRYVHYLGGGISWGTFAVLLVLTVSFFLLYRGQLPSHDDRFELWAVLCAWICLPIQMNYSIFYRSLLMFSPMFYRVIPSVYDRYRAMDAGSPFKKLIRWGGIAALAGYVLIRVYKMYTGDFISYGLYPYQIG